MTDRRLCELAPAKGRAAARAQKTAGGWAGGGGRVGAAGGQVRGGKEGPGRGTTAGVSGRDSVAGLGDVRAYSGRPTPDWQGLGTGSEG